MNGKSAQFRVLNPDPNSVPRNVEFEREILGTLVFHPEQIPFTASVLDVADFYADEHQTLFKLLIDLSQRGIPILPSTIEEELRRLQLWDSSGGIGWFSEILSRAGSGAFLQHHAGIVREKGQARRLMIIAEDFLRDARAGTKMIPDLALGLTTHFHTILSFGQQDDSEILDRWPKANPRIYHGVAGQVAQLAAPHTEADPVAILIQFLVAAGNVIGRRPHFVVDASVHHINLFVALVGPTAVGRKGTSWDIARWVLSGVDDTWTDSCIKGGLTSGEGLIFHVRDDADEPIDRRLMVVETELSRPLMAASREQNTLSAVLRQAWDVGNLRTLSKNQPLKTTGAHISLIGHITQADLRRHMSVTDSLNGFANRFLWTVVRRSNVLPFGDSLHRIDWTGVHHHLARVIPLARVCERLERDEGADQLWATAYHRLSSVRVGTVAPILSRAEPQVMRLACVYALLDGSAVIRVEHLEAALALWDYCEASVRLVFGESTGDSASEKLLAALRANPNGLTRWHINAQVFSGHKRREEIDAILSDLYTLGAITREVQPTAGRSREIWRLALGVKSEV